MRLRLFLLLCIMGGLYLQVNAQTPDDITLPQYSGMISVAPDAPYFVDEQGQGFLVIGQNDGVPWPGLSALLNRASPEATEAYVRDLRAHGITVSRIMIEYAQESHTYLENPVGVFSESMTQFWDDFIAIAERDGLYLLLTPYDTFWQNQNWEGYPYSAEQRGPCERKHDWLTSRPCIDAQKARWQFIIEHWGGSPNIFAWDLMNEIELYWNATPEQIDAYITEMAAYVRELEMNLYGRTHLLTASSAAPAPTGALGRIIFNHPALDFANTHLYIGENMAPENTIGSATTMAGGVVLARDAIRDGRPYFDSESGPINDWIENVAFDKEYHHNMSWGHFASGGAGSGMRWPYTNPHWILPELRDNLLGLARFASTIDWAGFDSHNINNTVRASRREIIDAGMSDGHTAVIWLLLDTRNDDTITFDDATVTIGDVLPASHYQIEFWETDEGRILQTMETDADSGELEIALPRFDQPLKDVALIIRPGSLS